MSGMGTSSFFGNPSSSRTTSSSSSRKNARSSRGTSNERRSRLDDFETPRGTGEKQADDAVAKYLRKIWKKVEALSESIDLIKSNQQDLKKALENLDAKIENCMEEPEVVDQDDRLPPKISASISFL